MSRIEKTSVVEERARDEITQEDTNKSRKRRPVLNCFFILLGLFVACVLWIAWTIASTGFVYVPLFSSVAFHKPEPIRIVASGIPVDALAESKFKSVLAERLQSGGGILTDRSISLTIPESSLTALLRKSLASSSMTFIDSTAAQIAVLPNGQFELFIPLKNGTQKTAVIAHFSIAANHGIMNLTVNDVSIGSFHAPRMLVASIVESSVNAQLTSFNQSIGSYMEVDALTYAQGTVTVSGVFTVTLK